MSKFNELDAEIIKRIRGGAGGNFWTLMRHVRHLCEPLSTDPYGSDRVLDRRLQALRKAGKIEYDRTRKSWSVIAE